MRRLLLLLALGMVALWTLDAQSLLTSQAAAQEAEDEEAAEEEEAEEEEAPPAELGWSGRGNYYNIFKILAAWFFFLIWVHTVDWAGRDTEERELNWKKWNPILFGSFLLGFLLMIFIPFFWIGFPVLILSYAVPMTLFVRYRNELVEPHETVMTRPHLRYWFARKLSRVGGKMQAELADPHTTGSPVVLTAFGGEKDEASRLNLMHARNAPGFFDARRVIAEGLYRRSDAIMLDYTKDAVGVRHMVDGVWHNAEPWEREPADALLESFKLLCGLNAEERRARQEGPFNAEYLSEKYSGMMTSQGTATGERVIFKFEGKKTHFDEYAELEMRPKMEEEIKELMGAEAGFVIFSGMPASGLRSTMTVALTRTDRFMRELVTVEDEENRYEEIENVQPILYKAADGQAPDQILQDIFYKEPNVVVVRDLVNGETVRMLAEEVDNNRLSMGSIRAKDSSEALLRVLAMGVPPADFARGVSGVLCQRLIRRLCEECKEAYAPTPQMLAQLRIPEGRVEAFYRPRTPQEDQEICANCSGIGYVGRTAIFELLVVNDNVRKVLASKPKLDVLRQVARKSGLRGFQEEGVVLVAKGVTSLQELTRVLKL